MACLHSLVHQCVTTHTERVAVIFDDGECVTILTYGEMWRRAVLISKVLQHYNVSSQIVGLCIPPSLDFPSAYIGILITLSAVYPFETDGLGFIKKSILKMHVRFVLMHINILKELENMIKSLNGNILHSKDLIQFGLVLVSFSQIPTFKNSVGLAYCLTTSGTTAEPKIVRVPHSCILPNIIHLRDLFEVTAGDLTLLASPLTFDPSVIDIFVTLTSGASLLIIPNATKLSSQLLTTSVYEKHKITILQVTPALLSRFTASQLRNTFLSATSHLRILAVGGERFPSLNAVRKWRDKNNKTRLFNLYGTTELSCWATVQEITTKILDEEPEEIPLGQPLLQTSIKVLDDRENVVQEGDGEMFIGSSTRQCFLDDDVENHLNDSAEDVMKWRKTGDLVRVREDGSIIYLCRIDDQIKRNGKRLNTKVIEEVVLSNLDDIKDCRVVYVDSQLVIFVSSERKPVRDIETKVDKCVREMLPRHYWPDTVYMLENLPLTKHGKVDKRKLIQITTEKQQETSPLPPEDKLTEWAQHLWKDLLAGSDGSVIEIADDDNFIKLGGDSFKAVHLINSVEKCFGTRLPLLLETILNKDFNNFIKLVHTAYTHSLATDGKTKHNGVHTINSNNEINGFNNSEHGKTADKNRKLALNISSHKNGETTLNVENSKIGMGDLVNKSVSNCSEAISSPIKRGEEGKTTPLCTLKRKQEAKELESEITTSKCKCLSEFPSCLCYKEENAVGFIGYRARGNRRITFSKDFVSSVTDSILAKGRKLHVELSWKQDTGKCVDASPLIAIDREGNHLVLIGSHSHIFSAVSLRSGSVVWRSRLGDRIESSACLSACGRFVIAGCYDGCLYVMNVWTGKVMWRFETGGAIKSSPVVDIRTSLVIFGSHDHHLYAVDLQKEIGVWKCHLGEGSVFSSPALDEQCRNVFVGTLAGNLTAINIDSGEIQWTCSMGKPIFSSPVVLSGNVIVGCVDGTVNCVSGQGQKIWVFQTEAPVFSSPSVCRHLLDGSSYILIGSHDKCLYCLSEEGKQVWRYKTKSAVYSTPSVLDYSNKNTLFEKENLSFCNSSLMRSEYFQNKTKSHYKSLSKSNSSSDSCNNVNICNETHNNTHLPHQTKSCKSSNLCLSDAQDNNKNTCRRNNSSETYHSNKVKAIPDINNSNLAFQPTLTPLDHLTNDLCTKLSHFVSPASSKNPAKTDSVSVTNNQGAESVFDPHVNSVDSKDNKGAVIGFTSADGSSKYPTETHSISSENNQGAESVFNPCENGVDLEEVKSAVTCFTSTDGCLYFVDVLSGQCLTDVQLDGEVFSSPVCSDHYVVVGCRDNNIYCFKYTWK